MDLVGKIGDGLYTPENFGLQPVMASTACYRGYIMRYVIKNKELIIDGFLVRIGKNGETPEINSMKAIDLKKERESQGKKKNSILMFNYDYRNLNINIPFNGILWLGKDFIQSQYVHMGFQSPTAYRCVIKFEFENGFIIALQDVSENIKEARKKGDPKGVRPKSMSPYDITEWIETRFSLDPRLD